jgi:excisionase family DNA binding protein
LRDDLQFLLRQVQELPAAELPRFLGELEEIRCTAMARLVASATVQSPEADRLLSVDEASLRLGISKDYLFRHGGELPFTRRIGRKLLFSSLGINKYIEHQNVLTAKRQTSRLIPVVNRATRGSR